MCNAVPLPDSVPDLRRQDELSNRRKSLIEQKKVKYLKTRVFRMQYDFALYFTGQVLMNFFLKLFFNWLNLLELLGGADMSFARPRRKQATATKLAVYSTYSPQAQYTS
jgi:hypothetical protein